ncbi:TrkH family potassium uptake protein [Tenacibaculum finnmarkense]|uniref:TrkH family potassium uptake protein n=1 Tax=Tenacibaculum finnmarkense TaxID=2781243 RepID=UPI00187B7445|nr:potassium transporter TrkG [Tenacibaculum finnmarkense]MBE7648987.1 TrkH family potassium uptake protein [Tenacibaculum finnmarkense genomovar ulcerans]MBE7661213.1 TrkH family potassium uptake protein [Tenacibaculum finnmarkense genomovar finnmarkense]MBE7688869.1 TrkH family potassium uptake protein [Tenacibaculum finnmarkense genomovar ulcerans]MCG8252783.1 TrkH family potassium uptake protein [Tenacibaculum finnmarkense genomovar finnmarkense]MCG8806284.1 TrkH family potassium uptake pr
MENFNLKLIYRFLGITAVLNGLFMWLSLPFSFYYDEPSKWGILNAGLITIATGLVLFFFNKPVTKKIKKKEGYLIVTLGWLILTITGMLPYLLSGSIPSVTNALFETISGYSTTGSSILTDIESMPKGILFWRSATHWIGGMGIIVLTIAILPLLGIGGMQLFMAEAPGPSADKLHPRITDTAKRLWLIYVLLTFVEFLLLKVAGMGWFDALNHAMATISTGGFSTKNASVAHWNGSPFIQYIIIFFMFLAGINFVLTYFALKGKVRKVIQSEEFKYYFFGVLGISSVIAIMIIFNQDPSLQTSIEHPMVYGNVESAIRHSLFSVLSVITTTGFVTADFTMWNYFVTAIFFSLFFLGGSAGSTSGGVKIVRHIILLKSSFLEFKKSLHPNAIIPVRYDGKAVKQTIVFNILSFFVLYMFIFIMGTIILAFFGLDFYSALAACASSLGNIGPGLGSVSPVDNFNHLSTGAKLFCSFLMLIGRLELFTVLILFTPFFWRKN